MIIREAALPYRHLLIKQYLPSTVRIVNFVIVSAFINYEKFMKASLREFPGGIPRREGAPPCTKHGRDECSARKNLTKGRKRDETSKKRVAVAK